MRSQKRVRDELQFVTEFATLFDILQQVASAQLHRLEGVCGEREQLTQLIATEGLALLPSSARQHPLVRGGERGRLMIVMTSDEGLVGPLHSAVIRQALIKSQAGLVQETLPESVQWLLIGSRGQRLLGARASRRDTISMPHEEQVDVQMHELTRSILMRCHQERLRDVWLVSPRFISTMRQDVAMQQLLPLPLPKDTAHEHERDLVLEPSLDRVLECVALVWTASHLIEAYWSARRAEFAARALHIEFSRQELAKRAAVVHHEFFKTLHERVDVLVRETCVVQRQVARRLSAKAAASARYPKSVLR